MQIAAKTLWALTESWGLPDAKALELIGYSGRLGRDGKRPHFRLSTRQQRVLRYLLEIDGALRAVHGTPGPWLQRKLAGAPFQGRAPIDFMTGGRPGGPCRKCSGQWRATPSGRRLAVVRSGQVAPTDYPPTGAAIGGHALSGGLSLKEKIPAHGWPS